MEHNLADSTQRYIEVTEEDLPLHCPMPGMSLWNSHPRVFLPLEEKGEALCPYCGTLYKLKGEVRRHH
ncbi:MAG: zinc-finger domain-containing protein [Sulfuricella denitrificans]|nr:zinc-finger domain-containing protein [Sulfuricella denitrificans]